jgi:uncharacterized protein (DUF362 family)
MNRRKAIPLAGVALVSGYLGARGRSQKTDVPRTKSAVAVLKAASYDEDLVQHVRRGVTECGLRVKGKRVLLKPNLVEFENSTCINTDPRLVAAAVEVFDELGATEVLIGEGPGHRRDTMGLVEEAGHMKQVRNFESRFVDLNRDDVSRVSGLFGEERAYLPNAVLAADIIVSMPKLKTHHWAGATVSMKNFFGVVPGSVYGWPKNRLHYFGIQESIVNLHRFFRQKSFAIVDGIIGMEGNGPIQGTPRHAGVIVFGEDLVAVDATCCRVMGIDPGKVGYLVNASAGNLETAWIEQRGESVASVKQDFTLIPEFRHLRGV